VRASEKKRCVDRKLPVQLEWQDTMRTLAASLRGLRRLRCRRLAANDSKHLAPASVRHRTTEELPGHGRRLVRSHDTLAPTPQRRLRLSVRPGNLGQRACTGAGGRHQGLDGAGPSTTCEARALAATSGAKNVRARYLKASAADAKGDPETGKDGAATCHAAGREDLRQGLTSFLDSAATTIAADSRRADGVSPVALQGSFPRASAGRGGTRSQASSAGQGRNALKGTVAPMTLPIAAGPCRFSGSGRQADEGQLAADGAVTLGIERLLPTDPADRLARPCGHTRCFQVRRYAAIAYRPSLRPRCTRQPRSCTSPSKYASSQRR
jgi:hypothetical protein